MASECLDEGTVVAFLDGTLRATERADVEDHLGSCDGCMELVTAVAADHVDHKRPAGPRPFIGRLVPGSRVARYQILNAVGRGGMGEVYAAYHPDLDRRIALKIVSESGAAAPDRSARLLREARAIALISHPNVITVYDAGTVDDHVYIAMEFIEGQTLDAWVGAQPRGWREVLDVFIAAGRGLAAAHAAGVVHRDFKPQNIMIGRDGSVRVMDFGLARVDEEPFESDPGVARGDTPALPMTVTKTGAIVGTPAYMAPEQFRRETLDGRADQFSFCVALHEALHGQRPTLAHLHVWPEHPTPKASTATPNQNQPANANHPTGGPAWLRAVIARGLSDNRDDRFPSMDALLAAVNRGQRRVRQRTAGLGIGIAIALLSVGAWRLANARRVSCAPPTDRLAAVWSADESNPRRQAIHRAFTGLGRSTAEAAWQQVARALDEYAARWSAMYVQTCEATNVRGEQSGEVLDLRMGCLSEALDGARALTEVLARADQETVLSQTVTAAQDLALGRCADVATLRAAVPLPRDPKMAETVRGLRRELRDANALEEVGHDRAADDAMIKLLPRIEATGYKPLIAEALYLKGALELDTSSKADEGGLERAFYQAVASRDDITAAKAASALVYLAAARRRRQDSDRWAAIGHAILDRLTVPQPRIRAWILHNQAVTAGDERDFESGCRLLEQALALKEGELGTNHPDVARTATALAWMMTELGQADRALPLVDRAVATLALDPDNIQLAFARNNRGDALNALRRYAEAEADYQDAERILQAQLGPTNYKLAYPMHGLGEARLGRGDPAGAVRSLEGALRLKQGHDPDQVSIAETQFALARALVANGQDRGRARALAIAARDVFARHDQARREHDVVAWLGARPTSKRP